MVKLGLASGTVSVSTRSSHEKKQLCAPLSVVLGPHHTGFHITVSRYVSRYTFM